MAEKIFTKFICAVCGHRDRPCPHWEEEENDKRYKFIEGALCELNSDERKHEIRRILLLEQLILERVEEIWNFLRSPKSATLQLLVEGKNQMSASILVGGTASSLFQEWSGPSGTGVVVPNAGAPAFTSSDPTIATVDPATGVATGVAPGTATITGTDPVNSLTASDTLTVNPVPPPPPVSATLTLTAN